MPSPLHYLPLGHRDWLSSSRVRRMPPAVRSYYLDLLCHQWEDGSVPSEKDDVAALLGISGKDLAAAWRHLEPAFPVDSDGERRNPRMARERAEVGARVAANAEKNRQNGSKGGRPSKKANVNPTVTQGVTEQEPSGFLLGSAPETQTEPDGNPYQSQIITGGSNEPPDGQDGPTIFDLVKRTLTLVAEGLKSPHLPSDDKVREWLSDRRKLAPLVREIGPERAAAVFVWCAGHFDGGKPWGTIRDNLAVYEAQMREGVAFVPRSGSTGGKPTGKQTLVEQMEEAARG